MSRKNKDEVNTHSFVIFTNEESAADLANRKKELSRAHIGATVLKLDQRDDLMKVAAMRAEVMRASGVVDVSIQKIMDDIQLESMGGTVAVMVTEDREKTDPAALQGVVEGLQITSPMLEDS